MNEKMNLVDELDELHGEHVIWFKQKKKNVKIIASIVDQFRMSYFKCVINYLVYFVFISCRRIIQSFTNVG